MNEFDYIQRLRKLAEDRDLPADLVRGIGDDAAVLKANVGLHTVVTTDLLVENIDFRRETTSPELLGHKALAVSLSDIAAMGARPRWALMSVGVPEDVWESNSLERFHQGFFQLADRFGVKLIGGDLSRTNRDIVVGAIVIGECRANREVLRSGAQPGDQIYVTGYLGDAAAGLRLLERGARLHGEDHENSSVDHLLLRHLRPEPRVGWGILSGDQQLASAMIDISDGLSSDLNHLCDESNVGGLIDASVLPIDQVVKEICGRRALDPLMLALHGGEDYELLFTVRRENVSKLPTRVDGVAVTRIGEIADRSAGVRISEGQRVWELESGGWQHFA